MTWTRFLSVIGGLSTAFVLGLWSIFFIVPETNWALVLQFGGVRGAPREPGLHMVIPVVQEVITLERRTLSFNSPVEEVIASDQKRLLVDAITLYKIVDPVRFYMTLGSIPVAESRLSSLVSSGIRSVLAQSTFLEIVRDKRVLLMKDIQQLLDSGVSDFGIEILGLRLRRVDLPLANSQAIYRRMQTEREQEAAEIRAVGQQDKREIIARSERDASVIISFAKRDANIIRGYGDACRSRIFAHVTKQGKTFFSFYRTLQSYRKAFQADTTTFLLGEEGGFFRFFQNTSEISVKDSTSSRRMVNPNVVLSVPDPVDLCGNLISREVVSHVKK